MRPIPKKDSKAPTQGPISTSQGPASAVRRRIEDTPPRVGTRTRTRALLKKQKLRAYAEAIVITLLMPAIGMVVERKDPLFLSHGFSWLAVPPVLVALRHGFGAGVTSAILLLSLVAFTRTLPAELAYGVMLLTMIVGQVSASIRRKSNKLETDYRHLRTQFDGFSRSYMLLELSHERLEQRAAARLTSLRGALHALIDAKATREDDLAAGFTKMLGIMASYGRVQAACVHLVDGEGRLESSPIASIGAMRPFPKDDVLVKEALDSGEVVHAAKYHELSASTTLLAAIPLLDVSQKRIGVVAIQSLPFVAFEASNLRLLYVIAGYTVVSMRSVAGAAGEDARETDRWSQFVERLERAGIDARDNHLPSVLAAFSCKKGSRGTIVLEDLIARDLRTTDWPIMRRDRSDNPVVLVVMPLTDADGAFTFRARIDRLSRERNGADMASLGVSFRIWLLKGAKSNTILAEVEALLAKVDTTREAHENAVLAHSAE
ncbi:MAG: GAF domain-containing protein [Polyangiaceae bacterium]|nr:GAF domain-containing protein [Polyangiaceae bacterium]